MTFWIVVGARVGRQGPGVDAAAFEARAHDLVGLVSVALGRAFDGERWLRRQFPSRTSLNIELNACPEGEIRVERLKNRNYDGVKELRYRLWVPGAWFGVPGDGLLGVRLFRAVLALLTAVGAERELGGPPLLRSATADPGRPGFTDLFSPRGASVSRFAPVARRLTELAEETDPDQLVLAGFEGVPEPVRRTRELVSRDLGVTEEDHLISTGKAEGVRVWKLRRNG